MKEIIKPCISIFLILSVASAALAIVFALTEEPIAEQARLAQEAAMNRLVEAEAFEELEENLFWRATVNNESVGYIVRITPRGFGGPIEMLVAVDPYGVVAGVEVIGHSETPGLGTPITEVWFTSQFEAYYGPFIFTRTTPVAYSEIPVITGATVSTQGVINGVNEAIELLQYLKGGN